MTKDVVQNENTPKIKVSIFSIIMDETNLFISVKYGKCAIS